MSDAKKNLKNLSNAQNQAPPPPEPLAANLATVSPESQAPSLEHSDASTDALLRNSYSSVFERVDPATRRDLDRAIVDRRPASLRAVYRAFKLDEHGVSHSAFFRYATRLRTRVALVDAAELALPPETDITSRLPQLIAQQMFEALTIDAASPRALQRLAETFRTAAKTHVFMRANRGCFNPSKPDPQEQAMRQKLIEAVNIRLAELESLKAERAKQEIST